VPCHATHDLDTALAAVPAGAPGGFAPRVLVISGTGSCCFGRGARGVPMKAGGWGHLLGDGGSAYEIGLCALKAVATAFDATGRWPKLGRRFLRELLLNDANQLIDWAQGASKAQIAGLAMEVFAAARQRDALARNLLALAAGRLATDAVTCARRLFPRGTRVEFVFTGSTLLKQPGFAAQVGARIRRRWPRAVIVPLQRESVWGAIELAAQILAERRGAQASPAAGRDVAAPVPDADATHACEFVRSARMSPTEQRNPRSRNLDRLSVRGAVALMLAEDARIPRALRAERRSLERAVDLIGRAVRGGGRLFYLGAGTSGRLGVLDASECPVTFGSDPETVQGIIAGGQVALWRSIEGAEDDADAGAQALVTRGVGRRDVVVGIAASGRTPFVWGGLIAARKRGARTVLMCFNPHLQIPRALRPDVVLAPDLGPEILTGSTRLKAGTATKLLLNMFTTLAMVRAGKVISNLMVNVNPANVKLRDRAVRIVQELSGKDYATTKRALQKSRWIIRAALRKLRG
jgi:N-acetylmuramic acid 6-phosphate etherase